MEQLECLFNTFENMLITKQYFEKILDQKYLFHLSCNNPFCNLSLILLCFTHLSRVIVKSIIDPNNDFWRNFQVLMG